MKNEPLEGPVSHETRWLVHATALAALVLGALVLAGWVGNITALKTLSPSGAVNMKPNTALALVLAGAALLLLARPTVARWPRRAGTALALLVSLLGAATLGEYLFGWQLGIDELLFKDDPNAVATLILGRMAPSTAVCFGLLGLALAGLGWEPRRGFRPAELLAIVAGITSLGSLAEYVVGQPMLYHFSAYTRMALPTAFALLILSSGVLLARPAQGVLGLLRASGAGRGERTAYWLLAFVLLAVMGIGSWFYHAQEQQVRHEVEDNLQAVASLKASQIVQWRTECLGDASGLMEGAILKDVVARWRAEPQAGLAETINAQLRSLQHHNRYSDIVLVDVHGQILLNPSGRTDALDADELSNLALALQERQPVLSDLHAGTKTRPAHVDLIAPLFRPTGEMLQPIGAVIMEVEAARFLYPLIQSWPVPSSSAESFLVRRDGDTVLFLNDTRHQAGTAFKLRLPLIDRKSICVAAALGQEGVAVGHDYRGVKVFSILKKIPDTSWFLITKMDEEEAFASWRSRATLIMALIVVLTLALAAAARTIGRQGSQNRKLARSDGELRKSNRSFQVLSAGNQVLMRAESEPQLLQDICQLLIDKGGYRLAWVGYPDEDEARSIRPVAHAGFEAGYLERLQLTWADTARGHGPAGTAIRTGKPSIFQDIHHDSRFAPWQTDALERGYTAVTGLPLKSGSRTFGVLTIYSATAQAFDAQELQLLEELAGDLAFGIMTLRHRAESQRFEQALRKSELKFRHLFEGSADALLVIDLSSNRFIDCNQAAAAMLGYEHRDELLNRHPSEISPPFQPDGQTSAAKAPAMIGRAVEAGSHRFEWVHRSARRADFPVEVLLTPIQLEGQQLMMTTWRDLTAHKKAEAQLQLRSSALQAAAHAIVITDRQGTIEWVNPAFCALTGYDAAEAVGRNPRDLVNSGRHDHAFFKNMWGTILAGNVWRSEIVNRSKDGSLCTEFQTITPVRDARGEISHFIATKEDITERKKAEARIREQADLLNQTHDAIMVAGLDNRFTFWNEGADRITGWSAAEALGQSVETTFGSSASSRLAEIRSTVMSTGVWHGEFHFRRKDDRAVILDLRVTLVRDEAGQPNGRLSIGTDITAKKQVAEQFLRAQRMESLGLLASGIAHDLNNVLAPILMTGPLLRRQLSAPSDLRILDILEKSAERGAALVRQILGFVQGTSGEASSVQVKHLAREIVDFAHETFPKSITVESYLPGDLWTVHANPSQIHQVLLNLCVNARDAMPKGGTLTIRLSNFTCPDPVPTNLTNLSPGSYLTIQISDTGTGIPAEVIERIWDPFFTTKAPLKGTGLGLSTTRGIVVSLGGLIQVETAVGQGTTFSIYLPAQETGELAAAPPALAPAPDGNHQLILVVDDEIDVREIASKALTQFGYRVVTALDGVEAVKLFADRRAMIALVITDLNMPNFDGFGLTQALRRMKPEVKILVITGLASSTHSAEASKLCDGFLAKPFTVEELLASVGRILHSAALPDQPAWPPS